MSRRAFEECFLLFRRDAARWVRPQQVAALDEVSLSVAARLLFRHPPLRAMAWFRVAQFARRSGIKGVGGYVQRRLLRLYGLELAPSTPVGGGLYIAHPVGCVLHAESIGDNVTVVGQVTFGTRNDARWPVIDDEAFIGVGARVLGGITVGRRATIGANAVVVADVPDGATAVGIPARILEPRATAR
jgi:serine O-acetyltransferase